RSTPVEHQSLWVRKTDLATLVNVRDGTERIPGAQEEFGQREGKRSVEHQPERRRMTCDGNLPLQHRCIGETWALNAARNTEEAEFLDRTQHVFELIFHLHGQLGAAAGRNDGRC